MSKVRRLDLQEKWLPFELEIARLIKLRSFMSFLSRILTVGSLILEKTVLLSELYNILFHIIEIYCKYFLNIQIIFELQFTVNKIFEYINYILNSR